MAEVRMTEEHSVTKGMLGRLANRALGVPLVAKVIGANVIIVAVAATVQITVFAGRTNAELVMVLFALAAASLVNYVLVRLALQPVNELERLAERVLSGDFGARAARSPFADAALTRLGRTVNELLDSLAAERQRIQDLGAEVVYAQDAERSRLSHDLHDSVAQTLAAVRFQLAAASNEADGELRNRLAAVSGLVGMALEDIRNVSYSMHPRVAEDLGLDAALCALGAQVERRSGIRVKVNTSVEGPPVPAKLAATVFRVAQEALRNIEVHSHAKFATVDVAARERVIRIEVADDGRGFDPVVVRTPAPRSALASVKDRVVLAGGILEVDSVPNGGTRVIAELQRMRAAS